MPSASSMEPLLFEPFVWDGPPPLARPAPSHEPAYGSSYPDFRYSSDPVPNCGGRGGEVRW